MSIKLGKDVRAGRKRKCYSTLTLGLLVLALVGWGMALWLLLAGSV